MGARLPERILMQSESNETGHWEPVPIIEINDALLAECNDSWDDWRTFDMNVLPPKRCEYYKNKINQTIQTEYGGDSPFVLKDPRICRLLPLYRTILQDMNIDVRPVISFRSPFAVASSLHSRNGTNHIVSHLYWLRHVLDAELNSRDLPRVFVKYDTLLVDWPQVVKRLRDNLLLPMLKVTPEAEEEIRAFLNPKLRHHDEGLPDSSVPAQLLEWTTKVYCVLQRLEKNEDSETAILELDNIAEELKRYTDIFSVPYSLMKNSKNAYETKLDQARQDLAEEQGEKNALRTRSQELVKAVGERESVISEQKQQIDALECQLANEIAEIDRQGAELDQYGRRILELEQTVTTIFGSKSWRITKPLRAAARTFLRMKSGDSRASMAEALRFPVVEKTGRVAKHHFLFSVDGIRSVVSALRFGVDKATEWRRVKKRWPRPVEMPRLVRSLIRLHKMRNSARSANLTNFDDLLERLEESRSTLPSISIVMPVYRTPVGLLRCAIDSVRKQLFERWQLCICDDGSADEDLSRELAHWESVDGRIKVVAMEGNRGISEATNAAIQHAHGDFIAFLDHDDELTPNALAEVALLLAEDPSVDVVYTDQDKIDSAGNTFQAFHKPDWSPDFFRRVMYIGHLLVVRRDLVDAVNGFNSRFDRVQDYEFMLRVSEATARIAHIPKVLYHWRATSGSIAASEDAKGKIEALQSDAVRQHLQRIELSAEVQPHSRFAHRVNIHYKRPPKNEKISIVIPSKDHPEHIGRCLASIYKHLKKDDVEVVVVDNGTTDPEALRILREYPVHVVSYDEPFNYSRANNLGVAASSGSVLVLLNNDTEVITADWLHILRGNLEQDDVGAVGPVLLYPDSTVQHAGIVLGPRGTADHVMRGFPAESDGYAGSLSCVREVTAVTGACLVTRRETYLTLGGLVEHYATHYQDVDFCLRLRRKGLRILCVPDAKLVHYENVTRGHDYDVLDRLLLQDTWEGELSSGDPYFNPAFSLTKLDYSLVARD